MRHKRLNRFGYWVPGEAVLCTSCLESWWDLLTPPEAAVEDWIGLIDGRMWARRQADVQGRGVQELLRQLDHARHDPDELEQVVDDVDVSWEPSELAPIGEDS